MTITSFDKQEMKTMRTELNEALAAVAKKHGLDLSIGSISFTNNTFTTKISGMVKVAGDDAAPKNSSEVKWATDFLKNSFYQGVKKETLGKTISIRGETVTLVGMRSRADQPFVVKQPNGKYAAVGAKEIVSALGYM